MNLTFEPIISDPFHCLACDWFYNDPKTDSVELSCEHRICTICAKSLGKTAAGQSGTNKISLKCPLKNCGSEVTADAPTEESKVERKKSIRHEVTVENIKSGKVDFLALAKELSPLLLEDTRGHKYTTISPAVASSFPGTFSGGFGILATKFYTS